MAAPAVSALKEGLQEPNDQLQIRAAQALARIGGPGALPDALKSLDDQLRMCVVEALVNRAHASFQDLDLTIRILSDGLKDNLAVGWTAASGFTKLGHRRDLLWQSSAKQKTIRKIECVWPWSVRWWRWITSRAPFTREGARPLQAHSRERRSFTD